MFLRVYSSETLNAMSEDEDEITVWKWQCWIMNYMTKLSIVRDRVFHLLYYFKIVVIDVTRVARE